MAKSDKRFLGIIFLLFFLTIVATAWFFLVRKEYAFYVEAPCDPAYETCFARDCSSPDDCPPNGLEAYKMYQITARDFDACTDGTCIRECTQNLIPCTPLLCGETEGDTCVSPPKEE